MKSIFSGRSLILTPNAGNFLLTKQKWGDLKAIFSSLIVGYYKFLFAHIGFSNFLFSGLVNPGFSREEAGKRMPFLRESFGNSRSLPEAFPNTSRRQVMHFRISPWR
jgi:hypothetical protein